MSVSATLRQLVIARARGCCEYCLYPQIASFVSFEMEHIFAEKHRGQSVQGNLALACPYCNRYKGSDLGSIDPETGLLTPFFNPRTQQWSEHFKFVNGFIYPLTAEGRVTVEILQLNLKERVAERRRLASFGMLKVPTRL